MNAFSTMVPKHNHNRKRTVTISIRFLHVMYGGIRKYNCMNLLVIFNCEIMILYIGSTSFKIDLDNPTALCFSFTFIMH